MNEGSIEDRLAAAKAANPNRRLYVADSPAGSLILGAPRPQEYDAYMALVNSDDKADKGIASRTLLIACAVDPNPTEMAALLKDYVGLTLFADVQKKIRICIGAEKADAEKK